MKFNEDKGKQDDYKRLIRNLRKRDEARALCREKGLNEGLLRILFWDLEDVADYAHIASQRGLHVERYHSLMSLTESQYELLRWLCVQGRIMP